MNLKTTKLHFILCNLKVLLNIIGALFYRNCNIDYILACFFLAMAY